MSELGVKSRYDPVAYGSVHRQVLAIACGVGVLAFSLQEAPDGRVSVRGFPQLPLPQICASRAWLGIRCPACGLTRSIIHLAEGDWRASWRSHRLGALVAVVFALQLPYRLLVLRRSARRSIAPFPQTIVLYGLIALFVANWLVDLVAGRVGSLQG